MAQPVETTKQPVAVENTGSEPASDKAKDQAGSRDPQPQLPAIDVAEKGRDCDGAPISLDRRLFMQFMAFGNCRDVGTVQETLDRSNPQAVLYQDVNDPFGLRER